MCLNVIKYYNLNLALLAGSGSNIMFDFLPFIFYKKQSPIKSHENLIRPVS